MKKYILGAILFLVWVIFHGFIYTGYLLDIKFQLDEDTMTDAALASDYAYFILDVFGVLLIVALLTQALLLGCIARSKQMNRGYPIIAMSMACVVAIALCGTVFYVHSIGIAPEMKELLVKITYQLALLGMLNVSLCFAGLWFIRRREKNDTACNHANK